MQESVEKKTNTNKALTFLTPGSKESVSISVIAPVDKKQPVAGSVPDKKKEILNDTIKANENITVAAFPKEVEPTTDSILTGDTALTITTNVTVKKKLPVIHINELETFPLQFAAPVNYAESVKLRKNKTNNQNITTTQNRIGFNIKLSSKN